MKKILIGLLLVVVLLVAAVVAIPFLIPTETVKNRIIAAVEERTGRTLVIAGPVKLSVFPRLAVQLNDVALSNAPGGRADALVRLQDLDVRVALLPLLTGAVEVDRFVLRQPVVHLEVDAAGRPNWQLAKPGAEPSAPGTA